MASYAQMKHYKDGWIKTGKDNHNSVKDMCQSHGIFEFKNI